MLLIVPVYAHCLYIFIEKPSIVAFVYLKKHSARQATRRVALRSANCVNHTGDKCTWPETSLMRWCGGETERRDRIYIKTPREMRATRRSFRESTRLLVLVSLLAIRINNCALCIMYYLLFISKVSALKRSRIRPSRGLKFMTIRDWREKFLSRRSKEMWNYCWKWRCAFPDLVMGSKRHYISLGSQILSFL